MGLDMYFNKRIYLPTKKEEQVYPDVRVQEYTDFYNEKKEARIVKGIKYLICEVGYFRKANHIHKFIIDTCFDGDDPNCQDIEVPKGVFDDLANICKELLSITDEEKFKKKAEELLPTQEGFFFGSLEYDEYYKETLKDFLEMYNELEFDEYTTYFYHCWY